MLTTSSTRTLNRLETKVFDNRWLRPVLDDLPVGFLLECDERIAYINAQYASFLGCRPGDVILQHVSTVVAAEDAPRLLEFSRRRVHNEPAPREYDFLAGLRARKPVRLQASVSTTRIDNRVVIAATAEPFYHNEPGTLADSTPPSTLAGLSPRELEIMERILAGERAKEIAFALNISAKTVATLRGRMLRKLNLTDNRALFQYALRHHLVDWS